MKTRVNPITLVAYNVAFASHMAIMFTARIAWQSKPLHQRWYIPFFTACIISIVVSILLASGWSGIPPESSPMTWLRLSALIFICIGFSAMTYYITIPFLYRPVPRPRLIHGTAATLAQLSSTLVLLLFTWTA